MKNLEDAFTFGDQFLNDKSTEEEPRKANVETEVESMVTVPIHQASLSVPPLSTPIIDLSPPKPVSPSVQEPIIIATTVTTTTLPPPPSPPLQRTTDPDLATHVSALKKRSADLEQKNKLQDKITQALASRPPVQKSLAWKTSDSREAPSRSSKQKPASPSKQSVNDDPIPINMRLSESEDSGAAHLPKIKTRPDWLTLLPEEETPETPEPDWVIPLNDLPETENNWADAMAKMKKKLVKADFKGQAYKIVRPFHKNKISLQFIMEEWHLLLTNQIDLINPEGNRVMHDMSKPLPLGGPPDFGLEELVPSLWTKSESDYDISSSYGISHWWFKRKEFYITRHSAPSDRNAVRSHMKILSVVSLKTYSRYGYTFLKDIVLQRANYKQYKISEADFKNLHPNDFEDMYLLNLQGKLNHLSGADKVPLSTAVNLWTRNIVIRQRAEDWQIGIESYQTKFNITQPRWDATDFLFKEDYTIVHKTRAVI
ncbi:hypothetical protein Tco_0408834 [Tanacetum coccineum]